MVVGYFVLGAGRYDYKFVHSVHYTFLRNKGVKEKNILISQHDFRKAVALAWIDPEQHYPVTKGRKMAKMSTPAPDQTMRMPKEKKT
jgi:hypothetical protein